MKCMTIYMCILLLAPLAPAEAIDFDDYFEDATLRLDYFHTAHATCDEIALDQISTERRQDTQLANP